MKAILSILSLSVLTIAGTGCHSSTKLLKPPACENRKFRDSLMVRYVDSGAEKLPYYYNNPAWGWYMDSVIRICPNFAEPYQLKAVPAIKNGEYIKAYALDEKAASLDSQRFMPYVAFLKCIFTKDYLGAIKDFNASNRIIPGAFEMDHSFFFYLGLCYMELRNAKEAENNFYQDIFLQTKGDSSVNVHYNTLLYMGLTKMDEDQLDSASFYLHRCLDIYKELPEANYYLALIHKRKNEYDLEKKYLEAGRQALLDGYSLNEDNRFYVNYPRQITLYEIDLELSILNQK